MQTLDPAGEWLRLSEHYRQLNDDAIIDLARQTSGLTDIAQQVLAQEIVNRKLKVQPEQKAAPQHRDPQPNSAEDAASPYAEDRELVSICTVWSLADALKLQHLFDNEEIPFCIGPEKATRVDAVTSNFADGLSVQVMQKIGLQWTPPLLKNYFPEDEPPEEPGDESDDFAIHCPKCHSMEVVFDELDPAPVSSEGKSSSKFKWTCDSCGHEWEDDGIVSPD